MIAWTDHALFWPDEIYQGLEQAHRVVFGYGFVPWEFQDGARPWVFPGFIAAIFRLASLAGIDDSLVLVSLARTAMVTLAVAGIAVAMRLAGRLTVAPAAALFAGVIAGFAPLTLVFDSRCLAEAATAPLVVTGALLLLPPESGRRGSFSFWAGVLIGGACFLRYQVALAALGLALVPLLQRRWRELAAYVAGGAAVTVAGGALDGAIWGRPFHSLLLYLSYHLPWVLPSTRPPHVVEPLPPWFYLEVAWSSTGVALLAIAAGLALAAVRLPRARVPLGVVAAFVAFHSLMHQKEYRYLLSVAPLAAALAGAGLADGWERVSPRLSRGLPGLSPVWFSRAPAIAALLLGALLAARAATASFAELGQYTGMEIGRRTPWRFERDVNLLLHDAGTRADLCGLAMSHGRNMVWHGGYTYLHRDVPVLGIWDDARLHLNPTVIEAANYALVPATLPALPGFVRVASIGDGALLRRDGACVPHPELDDRLFERP